MAELMLVNPRKRRKSPARKRPTSRKKPTRRRRNPIAVRAKTPIRRRRRSNPIGGRFGEQIMNAAVGAGGALMVDVAMAKLPLPAQLTASAPMKAATQGAVSLAMGMIVAKFGKKAKLGRQIAEGGLTVALHGVGKGMIGPAVGLSGIDDTLLGMDDTLLGMGYTNTGWINPAGAQDFPGYSDLGYTEFDDYYDDL